MNTIEVKAKQETDKLIAAFLGVTPDEKGFYNGYELHKAGLPFSYGAEGNGTDDLKFNRSWDWLMPIVDKVEGLSLSDQHHSFYVGISSVSTSVYVRDKQNNPTQIEAIPVTNSKIEATYRAVVQFIQYYNQQSK